MCELFKCGPDLWQDSTLKAAHVEEKVGVVFAVDRDKAALPLDSCDRTRKTILDVPEDCPPEIHVVLHQPHASVSRPAFLVIVANNVLVVGVRVLCEVSLNQVTSLLGRKSEEDVYSLHIARVESNRVRGFCIDVLIGEEIIWHLRWACHLTSTLQAKH